MNGAHDSGALCVYLTSRKVSLMPRKLRDAVKQALGHSPWRESRYASEIIDDLRARGEVDLAWALIESINRCVRETCDDMPVDDGYAQFLDYDA